MKISEMVATIGALRQGVEMYGAEVKELRQALYDLVRAHNGYQHGMGPCICAAHENARKALSISRDDETPDGLPVNGRGEQT